MIKLILINILIIFGLMILRVLFSMTLYFKSNFPYKSVQNLLTATSILFPTVSGAICIFRYKRRVKDVLLILTTFAVLAASTIFAGVYYAEQIPKNTKTDTAVVEHTTFKDRKGNEYSYDLDKKGYDYLFINGTDECLFTDYCYLDEDGYLVYDSDLSITVKDKYTCVDTDGTVYYPVKYVKFTKDGEIKYSFNPDNYHFDRLGNAYTYDDVPYYDKDGNKYFYSFDSNTQKGTYTEISTGDTFDNTYSFVDEDGYFFYDKNHELKKLSDKQHNTYIDKNDNVYYWASGVDWEKGGDLVVIQ